MTDIYIYFIFAHYRLYGNAPVVADCCEAAGSSTRESCRATTTTISTSTVSYSSQRRIRELNETLFLSGILSVSFRTKKKGVMTPFSIVIQNSHIDLARICMKYWNIFCWRRFRLSGSISDLRPPRSGLVTHWKIYITGLSPIWCTRRSTTAV